MVFADKRIRTNQYTERKSCKYIWNHKESNLSTSQLFQLNMLQHVLPKDSQQLFSLILPWNRAAPWPSQQGVESAIWNMEPVIQAMMFYDVMFCVYIYIYILYIYVYIYIWLQCLKDFESLFLLSIGAYVSRDVRFGATASAAPPPFPALSQVKESHTWSTCPGTFKHPCRGPYSTTDPPSLWKVTVFASTRWQGHCE